MILDMDALSSQPWPDRGKETNVCSAPQAVSFASSAAVEIINLRGQIVKKGSVQGTSALDLSALDAGVYVVRASGKSVDFSGKIVLK